MTIEADIVDCAECGVPIKTLWVTNKGLLPSEDYLLIADWVFHPACWDALVERRQLSAELLRASALTLAARRETLCRLQVECPACSARQVQLINWDFVPAHWRCRECKMRFEEG